MEKLNLILHKFFTLAPSPQNETEYKERIFFFWAVLPALLTAYLYRQEGGLQMLAVTLSIIPLSSFIPLILNIPYYFRTPILAIIRISLLLFSASVFWRQRTLNVLSFAVLAGLVSWSLLQILWRTASLLFSLEGVKWLSSYGLFHVSAIATHCLILVVLYRTTQAIFLKSGTSGTTQISSIAIYHNRTLLFASVNILLAPLMLASFTMPNGIQTSVFIAGSMVSALPLVFAFPAIIALLTKRFRIARVTLHFYRASIIAAVLIGYGLLFYGLDVMEKFSPETLMVIVLVIVRNFPIFALAYYGIWIGKMTLKAIPPRPLPSATPAPPPSEIS